MKKILFSLIVLIFLIGQVSAQSFILEWDDEPYYDGDTIHFAIGSYPVTEMVFYPILNNNTNNGINVKVIRDELLILEGTSSYFCLDTCYPVSVDTSANSMYIPAGGSGIEGDFVGYYETNGEIGISLIEYKYYNKDNPEEYIAIIVKFDTYPTSIDDNIFNNIWVSDIYPNPTTNFVNINYELPFEVKTARVKIVNLLGSIVMEEHIEIGNNSVRMNVSNLDGGIYFYSLLINGEIYSTKKLIIR